MYRCIKISCTLVSICYLGCKMAHSLAFFGSNHGDNSNYLCISAQIAVRAKDECTKCENQGPIIFGCNDC